jgi:hypothetical protein
MAGQHARKRARSLALRGLLMLAALLMVGVVAALAWGFVSLEFFIAELAIIGLLYGIDRSFVPMFERWDRGATGEEHVGQILERLRDHGWHVLHDIDMGRGNVDHLLVGPAGVLTVETKSHGGRIYAPGIDEKMLKQAYAQAKAVSEACDVKAQPLLVFSRAYLYPRAVSRQRGVVVLPARSLPGHLARRKSVLSEAEARELYARVVARLEPASAR